MYILAALVAYFEVYLMKPIPIIRYVDEGLAVLCLLKILTEAFKKKLDRNQIYMLLLMLLILGIGLVSNYYTMLQENMEAIVMDVGSTFKVFVTYIGATQFLKPVEDKTRIIKTLATVMRGFVVVLFCGLVLHLTGMVPMGEDVRYGIPSYRFINDGAAQLAFMFFAMFVVLTADMRYDRHKRQYKMLFIVAAGIVWASTLRTRAILFVVVFFGLYWFLIVKNKDIKLNWKTMLLMGVFLLIFGLDQFSTYFGENHIEDKSNCCQQHSQYRMRIIYPCKIFEEGTPIHPIEKEADHISKEKIGGKEQQCVDECHPHRKVITNQIVLKIYIGKEECKNHCKEEQRCVPVIVQICLHLYLQKILIIEQAHKSTLQSSGNTHKCKKKEGNYCYNHHHICHCICKREYRTANTGSSSSQCDIALGPYPLNNLRQRDRHISCHVWPCSPLM